jgi:hypothetical protein
MTGAVATRAMVFVRSLPDHQLLDRIVRGRAWIPLLGVMLAGIVAMQVEVLKLGASVGRSIQRSTALTSRNELLRASVASLSDDARIERLAAAMGMVMPAPAEIGFLAAHPGVDVGKAVANLHTPNPTAFLALTTANGGVVTAAPPTGTAPAGVQPATVAASAATTSSTGPATTPNASTPTVISQSSNSGPATSSQSPAAATAPITATTSQTATQSGR